MADTSRPEDAKHPFNHVPVEITVAVGRARPKVKDLLRLAPQAILQLDRKISDPVELFVGDRLIARGELQELDGDDTGQLAVRLIEVADLESGF